MSEEEYFYVHISPQGVKAGLSCEPALKNFKERHKIKLTPSLSPIDNVIEEVIKTSAGSIVVVMGNGCIAKIHLKMIKEALKRKKKAWLYWPKEEAIEAVDWERYYSHWRHLLVIRSILLASKILRFLVRKTLLRSRKMKKLLYSIRKSLAELEILDYENDLVIKKFSLAYLQKYATPVFFNNLEKIPMEEQKLPGTGVYLRTDFWAKINSGGSYGHTCYVAKELAAGSENFLCLVPNHLSLLDDLKVRQIAIDPKSQYAHESDLVQATERYYPYLKGALQVVTPSFIYERICLGNYVGAWLSKELNIPYIAEYNGSEISMRKSFDGVGYQYEELYLKAEEIIFEQATIISVVSTPIKEQLIKRGVNENKILVNPNGADPEVYAPLEDEPRKELRKELGWDDSHLVIGFTGTFGGWHGIEVLAQAIPQVCKELPQAHFLLIGDGQYKTLVDVEVKKHQLEARVKSVGRVPQQEGARLLKACDIYVSPHSSHMIDSRFFGSPTKLFEYMAGARAIVASDLEQIGEVLSPAISIADIEKGNIEATDQRAVLCKPGDVEEFVKAIVFLGKNEKVLVAIGKNARKALLENYSWKRHIERLWQFIVDLQAQIKSKQKNKEIDTGDDYKDEVQKQWDNNPCGSHYVDGYKHNLKWFEKVQEYRYDKYAPWMPTLMEFDRHSNKKVLEVGAGIGTDLAQFAKNGSEVTDLDLSAGHLALAQENFSLRKLKGEFVHHDCENMPFADNTFDVVYSNGVIHHTPNTHKVVAQMYRVLKPGGRIIVMVYAENSLNYWRQLLWEYGLRQKEIFEYSIGHIMSRHVEITENDSLPLVKVYTPKRLKNIFRNFANIKIYQRQLVHGELRGLMRFIPLKLAAKLMGWNLIIKGNKPLA